MKKSLYKIGIVLLSGILLVGCTKVEEGINDRLNHKILDVLQEEIHPAHSNKEYYSYYTEPYIGRLESTDTTNIFTYEGIPFLMNLNIAGIVNDKYYNQKTSLKNMLKDNQIVAQTRGNYVDLNGDEKIFESRIYSYEESFITFVHSDIIDFIGMSDEVLAPNLAAEMVRILRSVKIDEEKIVSAYSGKEIITHHGTTIELFDNIAPVNGFIEELFIDQPTHIEQGVPEETEVPEEGEEGENTEENSDEEASDVSN